MTESALFVCAHGAGGHMDDRGMLRLAWTPALVDACLQRNRSAAAHSEGLAACGHALQHLVAHRFDRDTDVRAGR